MTKSRLSLALPLLAVLATGCLNTSNTPSKVSGKISYKGQPVTAGSISLFPKDGGVYSIPINADGTYVQGGLPAGEMDVTVETESANTNKGKGMQYGNRPGSASPKPRDLEGGTPVGPYVKIPAKYAKKETSGLKVTLDRGNNSGKDFDLAD